MRNIHNPEFVNHLGWCSIDVIISIYNRFTTLYTYFCEHVECGSTQLISRMSYDDNDNVECGSPIILLGGRVIVYLAWWLTESGL